MAEQELFMEKAKKTVSVRKHRRNKAAMPVGIVVIIFAVIGLAAVIAGIIFGVGKLTDQSAKKSEYESFITPVIMFDPDPFDDVTKGNQEQLINAAIWALLKSDLDTSVYATDDGNLSIPQADVEKYFSKLFGPEAKPEHRSVTGLGYEFSYDSAKQVYIVPITGVEPIYTPRVFEISKKGNTVELLVGYLGSSQWAQAENGDMVEPEPDKYVTVVLRESADGYYVSAIRSTNAPETESAPTTTTPPDTTQEAEPSETYSEPFSEPADTAAGDTAASSETSTAAAE